MLVQIATCVSFLTFLPVPLCKWMDSPETRLNFFPYYNNEHLKVQLYEVRNHQRRGEGPTLWPYGQTQCSTQGPTLWPYGQTQCNTQGPTLWPSGQTQCSTQGPTLWPSGHTVQHARAHTVTIRADTVQHAVKQSKELRLQRWLNSTPNLGAAIRVRHTEDYQNNHKGPTNIYKQENL